MVDAYRSAGGRGPLVVQVHLSYAGDEDTALRIAHDQWRTNVFAPPLCWDVDSVETFDEAAKHVRPRPCATRCRSRPTRTGTRRGCTTWWRSASTRSTCTMSGQEQQEFLDVFGAKVLPQLDVTAKPPR